MATATIEDLRSSLYSDLRSLGVETGVVSEWPKQARSDQLRPDGCTDIIWLGGRGSGKTRSGAEDLLALYRSGTKRFHVLAPTFADARDVCIEGPSGILACALPGEVKNWNRSMGELYFSNGSFLKVFSADEPDRLNGPQCEHLWCDEFGLCSVAAIDQAMFGLRLGKATSTWTSTPKVRPATKYVLGLFEAARVVRMRTWDNAKNLSDKFIAAVKKKYQGTRLGQAELEGELIEGVEGALWEPLWFEREGFRLPAVTSRDGIRADIPAQIVKVVVAIDPTVSDPALKKNPDKEMDACGLCVAGIDADSRGYVLGDYTRVLSVSDWAKTALRLYSLFGAAEIVYEANQGGELVRELLRMYAPNANVKAVWASVGKRPRAEPVSALYEQGRVMHCGRMDLLEGEMSTWDARDPSALSPNALDACVWAFHGLGLADVTIPTAKSTVHRTPSTTTREEEDPDDRDF